MTDFYPAVERGDMSIEVLVGPGTRFRSVELSCVLDHDDFNEVCGIEILDFESQLGNASIGPSPNLGYPRWSYDSDEDAVYIRVSDARAQNQISSMVVASITAGGQLVGLLVAWPK